MADAPATLFRGPLLGSAAHPLCDDSDWPLVHVTLPATTTLDSTWIEGVMAFVEQCAGRGPCVIVCEALHVPLPNPAQRRRMANAVAQLGVMHGPGHLQLVVITPFPMVIEGLVRGIAWLLPPVERAHAGAVVVVDTRAEGMRRARALLRGTPAHAHAAGLPFRP